MKLIVILIFAASTLATAAEPPKAEPIFAAADWLYTPIPANPVLDKHSVEIISHLKTGKHVAVIRAFGVEIVHPEEITADTPRYEVMFAKTGEWGPHPFEMDKMPWPDGTIIPPGSDGMSAVVDPVSGWAYGVWQQTPPRDGLIHASWGGRVRLDGDAREPQPGGRSTGAGIARRAGVITLDEVRAAAAGDVDAIKHALVFATDMSTPKVFRYPATATDGLNLRELPLQATLPEGARIQLDPSLPLPADANGVERAVFRALQVYGAYNIDNGRATMSIVFEHEAGESPGPTYRAAGITYDYWAFEFDWSKAHVLKNWDGSQ